MTDDLKVPPHSIEAEQAVLGGLMIDSRKLDVVADILDADHFFRHDHQLIYRAIASVLDRQAEADIVTVGSELGGNLDEVGGQGYLAQLFNQTPTAANIHHYAWIVADRHRRRRIIQQAGELAQEAYDTDETETDSVIDHGSQRLFELAEKTERQGFADFRSVLRGTVEHLDERHQARQRGEDVGIPTGIHRFDDRFGGFQPGDYVIVAGRPSMGKTGLALTWTRNMARRGYDVAFFSVEMPETQLSMRLLAQQSQIPVEKFRAADFSEDDWPKITQAVGKMADLPIHIDASSGVTPGQVYRRARQLKRRQGLDVLFVDYLQLMEADRMAENRQNTVAMMSRQLAKVAKDLNVVVIVLCQLSRDLEKRQDKTPMMADLRESGSLEQDADTIIFPFRPSVYYDKDPDTGAPLDGSEAKLIVGKMRQGPTGHIPCTYIDEQTFFGDRETREIPA
jgi:replicative DNA helicase